MLIVTTILCIQQRRRLLLLLQLDLMRVCLCLISLLYAELDDEDERARLERQDARSWSLSSSVGELVSGSSVGETDWS